jgi:hypothetical protein
MGIPVRRHHAPFNKNKTYTHWTKKNENNIKKTEVIKQLFLFK